MSSPYLATPAALAARTGLPETDLKLKEKLRAASDRFRAAVHHQVSLVVDDVVYLDGPGSSVLLVPGPIVSITSFVLDDGTVDGVPLARNVDYRASRDTGVIKRVYGIWPDQLEFAVLTYTHGYENENTDPDDATRLVGIPDEIQTAVLDMAETMLNIELGVQQRTVLGDSVQFGAASSVGTTQSWTDAVSGYEFGRGDRA